MEGGSIDVDLHIMSGDIPEEQFAKVQALRNLLGADWEYKKNEHIRKYCTNAVLHHFLIARKYNLDKSFKLLQTALEWRGKRNPNQWFRSDMPKKDMEAHEKESRTGKIQLCGRDRFDREVVVFDNSVQNTSVADGQLNFLAWNLELAIHTMPDHVDKYVVFMHLKNFSIFNSPPLQTTKETILMLTSCYPERLGHCICFQPPYYFFTVFNMLKTLGLIDKRTLNKVLFILGDVSDGSENDKLLSKIIGSNWKMLTNATSKVLSPGCSPGFIHEEYWPWLLQRWEQVNGKIFAQSSFDSTRLDSLSTKINPDGDDGTSSDEGSEGIEGATASPALKYGQESLAMRWINHKLRRGLRPAVSRFLDGFHALHGLIMWLDGVGNTHVYGTITTYVALAFAGVVYIIGAIIKFFFSTVAGTVGLLFEIVDLTIASIKCIADTTGACQYQSFFTMMLPLVRTILHFAPFVIFPVAFVVLLHRFNEQSHGADSFVENLERVLVKSKREARSALKRIRREKGKMETGSRKFESLSHPSLSKLSQDEGSDESNTSSDDDNSSDDGDEDNLLVYEGRLLRGKAGQKARLSRAHQRALQIVEREAADIDPSLGSLSLPVTSNSPRKLIKSPNSSAKKSTSHNGLYTTPIKIAPVTATAESEPAANRRSPTNSAKKRMERPSYSELPEEERPMDLDSDMESI